MTERASRRWFLGSFGAAATAGLAGCAGAFGRTKPTLTMIDWGYVYNNDILADFEQRHDCKVERQAAQGSAETLSLLRSGRSDHDLVPLGNYAVTPAMNEGLIEPIDLGQVPSYGDVFDFLKKDYFEMGGDVYGVPRSFGQTPLAVNTDIVDQEVTALRDLWSDDLAGVVGGRDDARLQVLYRNAAFDQPLNPTSREEVDFEALKTDLIARLENTAGLWNSGGDSEQLLRNETVGVQPVWNYVVVSLQSELPIQRVRPAEGTKAWFIQHCVRAGAENRELAHTFIEEWQSRYGYRSLMAPFSIAIPNERVFEEHDVDPSTYGVDNPDQFIYEEPKPPELVEAYSETWSEAKAEADI
ncbi:PotD/PotF family extracellular solute-binding protein [Halosegnis sp.]|uniref:ABC transporter substrate-binding protein n=1 Tax=Halosegnis sp. TaxID=2864959 RepID=UPI0035D42935